MSSHSVEISGFFYQILREIDFGESRSNKSDTFAHFRVSEIC